MSLGNTIRDARIAAHLSIEDLSESTSIRMGLLTEMENNNFSHCGGDTYARGHLRTLASRFGIDPQILIELYNEEHSSEHRAMQDLLVENNVIRSTPEKKSVSWKVPAAISLAVLFTLGIVQVIIANQGADTSVPATNATTSAESTQEGVTPTPTASSIPSPSTTQGATPVGRTTPIKLKLDAVRGNSFIDIIVDNQRVYKGSLFQGESKSFEGKKVISIYLSNPAGVDVSLDGSLLPPLGGQNEEVRRTFR